MKLEKPPPSAANSTKFPHKRRIAEQCWLEREDIESRHVSTSVAPFEHERTLDLGSCGGPRHGRDFRAVHRRGLTQRTNRSAESIQFIDGLDVSVLSEPQTSRRPTGCATQSSGTKPASRTSTIAVPAVSIAPCSKSWSRASGSTLTTIWRWSGPQASGKAG